MPALSIAESLSSVLIHSSIPVTSGVVGMLQDEDYLLVHSCTASATRQILRKINNNGEIYCRVDYDLQIFFDIEAEMLSPYGLANWHPGARLNQATINSLACANARTDLFQTSGGRDFYESPRLTFLAGDLPGVSFRVTREDASSLYLAQPPPVEDVTDIPSTPGSGALYDEIYEVSTIWVRRLNILGPVTQYANGYYYDNEVVWYTLPLSTPAPADYTAFEALPTTGASNGSNEIIEVFTTDVPGGTYLLGTADGNIGEMLQSGLGIPTLQTDNFLYAYEVPGAPGTYVQTSGYSETATTAAQFIASQRQPGDTGNQIDGKEVVEVYSIHQAMWLTLP